MDQRRPGNINGLTYQQFAALCGLIIYNFASSCHLVMVTFKLAVYKEIILLEGMLFAAAYYIRSLDKDGAFKLITLHILSIIPIFTKFNIFSAITMTVFMTLYPMCQYYISSLFVVRMLLYHENELPFAGRVYIPQTLHIIITLTYIIHHYVLYCNHRSVEDVIMAIIVFRIGNLAPNLCHPELVLMMTFTVTWMMIKSQRFPPLSTFPRRPLSSLNFL